MGNTPAELGYKPWALDYTPDKNGYADLPLRVQSAFVGTTRRKYALDDWDPPLRATRAAIEFASKLSASGGGKLEKWLTDKDKAWKTGNPTQCDQVIDEEITNLKALMQDDRDRYLPEIFAQADGVLFYYMSILGMTPSTRPWTRALMAFALQAGDFVAMHFKRENQRVRPSTLCPGLLVPFGPPRHPAFPSGHSTQAHLLSYVLLQIPVLRERFGKETAGDPPIKSELVWLARRVAINRERAGLHYRSDSTAGMHLALGVIRGLLDLKKQEFRDKVCEPDTDDETDLFRKFEYPAAGDLVSLECEGFTNSDKDGLLDEAIKEWAKAGG